MAGLQNSGQACWNFGWFCHHQKNKEAGNDDDSAKNDLSIGWQSWNMVEFLIVLPSLMMTMMMTLPIEGCFRKVKTTKGKCDGFEIERNDETPTSLLPSSFFCSCFRFLSTHSSPPPCRLALAVGNKLSCWHFLFAFLHREIPQTPVSIYYGNPPPTALDLEQHHYS